MGESDGNVRVAVRLRPLNARERLAGSTEVISTAADGRSLLAAPDRHFTFDAVYGPEAGQTTIFEELTTPLLDSFLEGFNCTILAYGQTGSGKTYTMGTSMDAELYADIAGIIPRAIQHLLSRLERTPKAVDSREFFELYVSFLELYNEEIIDLLNASSQDRLDRTKRPVLTIREDNTGAICIAGIKEERASGQEDILEYLRRGTLCRTTKSTDMNLVSSRSHAIFTILLRQRRLLYDEQGNLVEKMLCSKLHFVDLAGSERLKRTNAVGERAKESISINSGLLALGNVISALGDEAKKASHVPYRDSKLTRLLQDSLGGNSRTLMIACISPSSDNYAETVNTLKYANRARNIKNNALVNEDHEGNAVFEIMQLKKQVAALKTELLQLRGLGVRRLELLATGTPRKDGHGYGPGAQEDVNRVKAQSRELARKVDALTREKIAAEAERDFYKSASPATSPDAAQQQQISMIRVHLQTIAELREKLAELESTATTAKGPATAAAGRRRFMSGPSRTSAGAASADRSPIQLETPAWISKASDLIDRTRYEIRTNDSVLETLREAPAASATAAANTVDLNALISDQTLKEELIVSLENCQQEYLVMRRKYEERLHLLQQNIQAVQRERDQVLRAMQQPAERAAPSKVRLEERVRQMGKQIEELKTKNADYHRDAGSRHLAHETLARNLRAALQNAKSEKARLQTRLDDVLNRLRSQTQDTELTELRARERRAAEQAKKYKKAYEFQKNLLHKRSEQYLQSKTRIRTLVQALRKHRVPLSPSLGSLLDTPSLRHLPRMNPLETPMGAAAAGRNSSGLGSRCVSAADLSVERLSLDPLRPAAAHHEDDPDELDDVASPVMEANPMNISSEKGGGDRSRRRNSLLAPGLPLLAPPGCDVPRSVLRMSPLMPRRRDLFARIADAASLTLATKHLSSSTPLSSRTPSQEMPASPMKIDDGAAGGASPRIMTDLGLGVGRRGGGGGGSMGAVANVGQQADDDGDIVEFYRSSTLD